MSKDGRCLPLESVNDDDDSRRLRCGRRRRYVCMVVGAGTVTDGSPFRPRQNASSRQLPVVLAGDDHQNDIDVGNRPSVSSTMMNASFPLRSLRGGGRHSGQQRRIADFARRQQARHTDAPPAGPAGSGPDPGRAATIMLVSRGHGGSTPRDNHSHGRCCSHELSTGRCLRNSGHPSAPYRLEPVTT